MSLVPYVRGLAKRYNPLYDPTVYKLGWEVAKKAAAKARSWANRRSLNPTPRMRTRFPRGTVAPTLTFRRGQSKKKSLSNPKVGTKVTKVKTSRKLKTAIKKVVHDTHNELSAVGTYHVIDGGYYFNTGGMKRTFFTQPYIDNAVYSGLDTSFFTPFEVNHAASIMWNGKALARDYTSTVNNFDAKKVEIEVLSSSAGLWFKNEGQSVVFIDMYEFVAKTNSAVDPLTFWNNGMTTLDTQGVTGGTAAVSSADRVVEPSWVPEMKNYFSWKKKVITLIPGATKSVWIKGPSNTKYDFKAFVANDGTTRTDTVAVNKNVFVVVGIRYQPTLNTTGELIYPVTAGPNTNKAYKVAVKVERKFKLRAPVITDDDKNKDRKIFANYLAAGSTTHTTIPLLFKKQPYDIELDPDF